MSHHDDRPHGSHHHPHDHDGLADVLDLDAVVLAEPLRVVRDEIEALVDAPVRSVLDVGAGTGTGTLALLEHFPESHAVAVDTSEEMLEHLRHRASERGLGDRVTTIRANLDEGVPELEPVDLVWASASLHHLADPNRTLIQLARGVRPGGLLAVLELEGHPRFLPQETPEGVAESRAHALIDADREMELPTMGGDWGPRLAQAGLVVELARTIHVDLVPPLPPEAGRYAVAVLSRIRAAVAGRLDPEDLAALDVLIDDGPGDVRRRSDLQVRTERPLWIARRP